MADLAAASDAHQRARERFQDHRQAFARNDILRELYGSWYRRLHRHRPPRALGPTIELGSGPGLAQSFFPDLVMTDVVSAPWHQLSVAAESLPFRDGSLGALVLFDVLHHLPSPATFFAEAQRALALGGRVLICDPYISPTSYPIYAWLHEEGVNFASDPFDPPAVQGKDPFAGNQAVGSQLFYRRLGAFQTRFPNLRVVVRERLAGPSYPATGGFGRSPLLPKAVLRRLMRWESLWPAGLFRWLGFRTLVVLERAV